MQARKGALKKALNPCNPKPLNPLEVRGTGPSDCRGPGSRRALGTDSPSISGGRGFRVSGVCGDLGLGLRGLGRFGFRWFRVQGLGIRVQGLRG